MNFALFLQSSHTENERNKMALIVSGFIWTSFTQTQNVGLQRSPESLSLFFVITFSF